MKGVCCRKFAVSGTEFCFYFFLLHKNLVVLPNRVLFFESVGRIPNVSECDLANDRALFLQSFTRSYSFFSLSENEHWNFCQILTLAVFGYKLGIKTKVV